MLTVLPIRYVSDVEASRRFYAGLGLVLDDQASFDVWAELRADAGALGLHDAESSQGRTPTTVELGLATTEKLEDIARKLSDAGYSCELVDENFGRSIRVVDPDGVTVQIQEVDIDLAKRSRTGTDGPPQ
jgi:catechol 2,3-dioxygenase-like lactoylglutathione lyase family enzyme